MRYMLMIFADETAPRATEPEGIRQMYAAYAAFTQELRDAGKLGPADELAPSREARTVRVRDGRTELTDGPFLESREQLGGYYVIEAADMDEACRWAARVPSATHGSIEVRPLVPGEDPG
jgi:hypothetical protein